VIVDHPVARGLQARQAVEMIPFGAGELQGARQRGDDLA
jgi:hypothetical protein